MEMLYKWQEELLNLEKTEKIKLYNICLSLTGFGASEYFLDQALNLVKKHGLDEFIRSLKIFIEQYAEVEGGEYIRDSIGYVFKMVKPIIKNRVIQEKKPYVRKIYYARTVLFNKNFLTKKTPFYFSL